MWSRRSHLSRQRRVVGWWDLCGGKCNQQSRRVFRAYIGAAKGIGDDSSSPAEETIDAGDLGYCKFLKFKCAAKRTCDAWVEGGPIT